MDIEEAKVTFRITHVRLIHDAITRASLATKQLAGIMEKFQEQYRVEERVLTEAEILLCKYLRAAGVEGPMGR